MIDRLQEIYQYFGSEAQKEKLSEECGEYLESKDYSEVADVWIVATQLYINSPKVRAEVERKIERTLSRISEGYYNKKTGRKNNE